MHFEMLVKIPLYPLLEYRHGELGIRASERKLNDVRPLNRGGIQPSGKRLGSFLERGLCTRLRQNLIDPNSLCDLLSEITTGKNLGFGTDQTVCSVCERVRSLDLGIN